MKGKSSFRFNILMFSAAVFILTSIAYALWLTQAFPLWSIFIFLVIFVLLFAFIVDIPIDKFKWSAKKTSLLTSSIMIIAAIVTQSTWTIVTPNWSFTVSTDKSSYMLGEDVNITAVLKNTGFITHSFKSKVSEPVLIIVFQLLGPGGTVPVSVWWNSPWEENISEFLIMPSQSLGRSFSWNQTNISNPWFWNQTYMPSTYRITAFIPNAQGEVISDSYALFSASTRINVTSS